jgi:tetraacyldisaccharide 4'-kinase
VKIPSHPLARGLLAVPGLVYRAAVTVRNAYYDRPGAVHRAGLPVISVGNITVGGTGKTPVVAWIARRLGEEGVRPAVVSRGYGGRAGRGPLVVSEGNGPLCDVRQCGDEPHQLASTLPGTIVIVGSDRPAGATEALRLGAQLVLLDDGYQHRRLARDLDLLLLDSGDPFGNGQVLPAGPLREPLAQLRRAGGVLVTRSRRNFVDPGLERIVRAYNPRVPIFASGHRLVGFVDASGKPVDRPPQAIGFCGIGNPSRFREDLLQQGVKLREFHPFDDHRPYRPDELNRMRKRAAELGAALVTTEKDLARISRPDLAITHPPLCALRIEAEPFEPERLMAMIRLAYGPDTGCAKL